MRARQFRTDANLPHPFGQRLDEAATADATAPSELDPGLIVGVPALRDELAEAALSLIQTIRELRKRPVHLEPFRCPPQAPGLGVAAPSMLCSTRFESDDGMNGPYGA